MCSIRVNVYIYSNKYPGTYICHNKMLFTHCYIFTLKSLRWFTILFICYQHFQVQTPNSFPICIVEDMYIYDSIVTSTCTCIFLPTCRFIAEVKVFLWFSFGSVGLYQKDSYCVMRQNNINSISSFIFSENVFLHISRHL